MPLELISIRTEADYERAVVEFEDLWGARFETPQGDRLEYLAKLLDAYEALHISRDPSDPEDAITVEWAPRRPSGED